jgi:hypothetical protein
LVIYRSTSSRDWGAFNQNKIPARRDGREETGELPDTGKGTALFISGIAVGGFRSQPGRDFREAQSGFSPQSSEKKRRQSGVVRRADCEIPIPVRENFNFEPFPIDKHLDGIGDHLKGFLVLDIEPRQGLPYI